jgi:transposase
MTTPAPSTGVIDGPPPLYLHSDGTRSKRRRFMHLEKLSIMRNVERKMEEGLSQRQACEAVNIHHTMYGNWLKKRETLCASKNNKAKSLAPGRTSEVSDIQGDLLRFIFEKREMGMPVSIKLVAQQAAKLSPDFGRKTSCAQYNTARRFVKANGFVYRMGTNESQRSPVETAQEAMDFMNTVARPKVVGGNRDLDFIINMDQTPVPFTYHSKKTLEQSGRATVPIRKSTGDTKRATFALTITASGKALPPVLVFKGSAKGRIVRNEFPRYPEYIKYACQENAWMDERVMIMWVEEVLQPYVETAPDGVVPILFLDSYRCHMMASVVNRIQALGVEVQHIPGGCTGLCQPVDVGVNKPFKNRIRDQWERWMIHEGLNEGTTAAPTRNLIVDWVLAAQESLQEQLIKNAWRHGDFSWFPANEEVNE